MTSTRKIATAFGTLFLAGAMGGVAVLALGSTAPARHAAVVALRTDATTPTTAPASTAVTVPTTAPTTSPAPTAAPTVTAPVAAPRPAPVAPTPVTPTPVTPAPVAATTTPPPFVPVASSGPCTGTIYSTGFADYPPSSAPANGNGWASPGPMVGQTYVETNQLPYAADAVPCTYEG
jgi:hypothetical protein